MDISNAANQIVQGINSAISSLTNQYSPVPDVTGGASIATNHTTVFFNSCDNPAKGCPEACDPLDVMADGTPGNPS